MKIEKAEIVVPTKEDHHWPRGIVPMKQITREELEKEFPRDNGQPVPSTDPAK